MSGKKSSGKHYTSKGERKNVSSSTLNGIRAERSGADDMLNKQRAWVKGGNPWITMRNPNKEETDKLFIRVRYNDLMHGNAKDLRKSAFNMGG